MFQDVAEFWKVLVREDFYMHQIWAAQNQCGSGLARESGRSVTLLLTDTPLSRASPLPQGICVMFEKRRVTRYCPALASA
ncbi:hypothetical protein C3E97_011120 [Pseudomonas sp. MWU12-2115]|nr:hypothetical protein C3E97_011120 [Pseudomonas sp. MWU12-2115]